jgi:N-methylhydantoinase B
MIDGVHPANPKAEQIVPPDSLVEIHLPGGGGYGPPSERDPDLITRDLLERYVTH